jgi:hypothetical protein
MQLPLRVRRVRPLRHASALAGLFELVVALVGDHLFQPVPFVGRRDASQDVVRRQWSLARHNRPGRTPKLLILHCQHLPDRALHQLIAHHAEVEGRQRAYCQGHPDGPDGVPDPV